MSPRARAFSLLALCVLAACATSRSGPERAASSGPASSPGDSLEVLHCALRIGAGGGFYPVRGVNTTLFRSSGGGTARILLRPRLRAGWMRPNARLWGDRTLGANDIVRQMNSQCIFRAAAD